MADTISDVVRALKEEENYTQIIELSKKTPLLFYLLQNDPLKVLMALDISATSLERRLRAIYVSTDAQPILTDATKKPDTATRKNKPKVHKKASHIENDDIDRYFAN